MGPGRWFGVGGGPAGDAVPICTFNVPAGGFRRWTDQATVDRSRLSKSISNSSSSSEASHYPLVLHRFNVYK